MDLHVEDQVIIRVKTFVEILELLFLQLQIYLDGLCYVASSYALPFQSVVEPEYKDEKTHIIFEDEMISLDYFDHEKRRNSDNSPAVGGYQTVFDIATLSRNVYMDDRFFGIIE